MHNELNVVKEWYLYIKLDNNNKAINYLEIVNLPSKTIISVKESNICFT